MFEQPDGQDGEGEEHDEDEQVCAVLSVAFLSPFLRNDVLHGTVLLLLGGRCCSADTNEQTQAHHNDKRPRLHRPPGAAADHSEHHVGFKIVTETNSA